MINCPRCGAIPEKISSTLICKCGWSYSARKESSQKTVIVGMILAFTLTAGLLFHFLQWGVYGFHIFLAGPAKKVEICMDLKRYDCVEKNYTRLFQNSGDLEYLEELGEIQFRREKFVSAEQTYRTYFSNKGKSYEAAYYYAHSLAKTGDIETAIQYFDSILRSKPHVLMVTVMESYLNVLVSHNRLKKAREILTWVNKENKGAINTSDQLQAWRKKFKI